MPGERSPTFTAPSCISWSVSFPAGGLALRAEGHRSCSGFCQRCHLCFFFSLGPKHILGNSPTLTVVCCSSPSLSHKFFVISKTGTSLVTHELLALGFHSGFYRSRNTKCASYKQKQKRGKRPSPRARWVSAHTSVLSRLKPSCASVLHPT